MATDCSADAEFTSREKQALRRRLLAWYAKHRRDLPWRDNRDPYRVWVSEVMLQQTQVETVRPYFKRFVSQFPDVHALAAASEQQVLRLWEGLGYYRRARQLHAAAKLVSSDYDGQFPEEVNELQQLPGIGRYTAGAIASIAYDQRAPILEANTIRLLSRLVGYREDPTKSAGQKLLWRTAEDILPRAQVADFNQALMELGSLVCRPTDPACQECPLALHCAAFAEGLQEEIPVEKRKQRFTDVHEVAVLVEKPGRVLLRQCTSQQRWTGLWDFPRFAASSSEAAATGVEPLPAAAEIENYTISDRLAESVHRLTGITCQPGPRVKTIKHGVTRYRIKLDCYRATYLKGRIRSSAENPVRWVSHGELSDYPLSTTGRKLASLIAEKST